MRSGIWVTAIGLALVSGMMAAPRQAQAEVAAQPPIPVPAPALGPVELQDLRFMAQIGAAREQYEIGDKYRRGRELPRNPEVAVAWLLKAANQGDAWAEWELADMYRQGDGIPQDAAAGEGWLGKAAGHGFGRAQNALGMMYAEGKGVTRDDVEAYMWLDLAINAREGANLGNGFIRDRDAVAGRMTATQLVQAKARVKAWKPSPDTPERLASLGFEAYQDGDYATALRLLTPLADSGQPTAQMLLGLMYQSGKGVTQDDAKSLALLRTAADHGQPGAQLMLGELLQGGKGTPQDDHAALAYYRMAADQGVAEAQTFLAHMYMTGQGVEADPKTAYTWMKRAADQGFGMAQYILGSMYFGGGAVPADLSEAYSWVKLSTVYAPDESIVAPATESLKNLAGELSEAQRKEADAKVAAWQPIFEAR